MTTLDEQQAEARRAGRLLLVEVLQAALDATAWFRAGLERWQERLR